MLQAALAIMLQYFLAKIALNSQIVPKKLLFSGPKTSLFDMKLSNSAKFMSEFLAKVRALKYVFLFFTH